MESHNNYDFSTELFFINSPGVINESAWCAALLGANLISSLMPEETDDSQVKEMDQFQIVVVVRPTFAHNAVLISRPSLKGSY